MNNETLELFLCKNWIVYRTAQFKANFFSKNLLIYTGLHCVRRSSWTVITLATLMRGVGVKNRGKFADVLCGQPLNTFVEFVKQSAMQLTKCKYLHIWSYFSTCIFKSLTRALYIYRRTSFISLKLPTGISWLYDLFRGRIMPDDAFKLSTVQNAKNSSISYVHETDI